MYFKKKYKNFNTAILTQKPIKNCKLPMKSPAKCKIKEMNETRFNWLINSII